jgi:hypothetical protein
MAVKVVDPKTGKEKIVCGAQRQDGTICMSYPARGKTRCRRHGGHVPSGAAHPNFIHGKYSKVLRRDILQNYFQALESGSLLTQSNEIALYDARITMLLHQASLSRDTVEMMVALREIKDLLQAQVADDAEEVTLDRVLVKSIGTTIDGLVNDLADERRRWEEVYQVVENRRKLIESERKAIVDSQKMMTEAQALVLEAALVNIIRKHVLDADVRNAISAEFVQLSGVADRGQLESRSGSASAYGL